ncbi:sensor histidine kinase [Saccharopolyspora rhizosphaerae]|uniref:histidine kinase n=1 Tax=Saccharopolyspora rhizosphaerae TaxID=2492662 RepID=A0A426JRF6_9PSEU|nr:histidine kinase [Saccharopolyspora rhizosphaerae]RRO15737.1 sensor histidine kinase [Saccharopolyspora rhizosphaerae]
MRDLFDRERLLSWWDGKVHQLLIDIGVALLFSGIPDSLQAPLWEHVLHVAILFALLVRRRFPMVTALAAIAAMVLAFHLTPSWVALYTYARRHGAAFSTWVVGVALIGTAVVVNLLHYPDDELFPTLLSIGVNAALHTVPGMLGLWLHQRQELMTATSERIDRAERERALLTERAVTEERRRIARELHDVIAHRASVMSLQAGALTVHAKDEGTADTAEVIRDNSAKALTELRGMLRVLRESPSDLPEAPSLDDIAELVRDAGPDVRLSTPDELPETSGSTGRAAYRVVQEALTNAAQHAPGAPVSVVVEVDDDLALTVTNGPSEQTGIPGPGYGLLGMRERVALAGGSLEVGPTTDGGFRVAAVLPR